MAKVNWPARRLKTKLLALEHTGQLRPHHHTSYGGLLLIIALALVPILFVQHSVSADDTFSQGVFAVVPSPIPKTAPIITNLTDGKVVTTNDSLAISGTCPNNAVVKIFKNGVLAGSTPCRVGSFSLSVDLFIGSNSLIARAYNADNISGPDSPPVVVKLLPPGINSAAVASALSDQFYVTSESFYRGAGAGDKLSWPITVAGGKAPYVITVSWGDGKTETVNRTAGGQFTISHVYSGSAGARGSYNVVLKAVDQTDETALLQLTAVVTGNPAGAATTGPSPNGKLKLAIQSLVGITIVVLAFWIGEKRELRKLRHQPVAV